MQMNNAVLFLGAGFSVPAGLPSVADLFTPIEFAHSEKAIQDIDTILNAYQKWRLDNPSLHTEEFISDLYRNFLNPEFGKPLLWPSLVRFLGYKLAYPFARFYGRGSRSSDNIFEAKIASDHKLWWEHIFSTTENKFTVITTNWDIMIERALRPTPTKRRPIRPGFHYGNGAEMLKATSAYPNSKYRENPLINGLVPLLKLHGSLNWAVEHGLLVKYGDLRPAFRGDAAIIPPLKTKFIPEWASAIWKNASTNLQEADLVLIVGYSFPEYDTRILDLFDQAIKNSPKQIHVFDPNAQKIIARLEQRWKHISIYSHNAIPEGIKEITRILK